MTQAHFDMQLLQKQLEQQTKNTNLTTQSSFNESPVLFLEAMEQDSSIVTSDQTSSEQNNSHMDQKARQTPPEKQQTSPEINKYEQSHRTPPSSKKRYEMMKDHAFLSSPIYPPILSSKPSLSTNLDDLLIPLLSHDCFIIKSQLTSLYMHRTDYTFKLFDKNQDFSTSAASEKLSPYQYWLNNGVKIFSLQFNFLRPSILDLKTDNNCRQNKGDIEINLNKPHQSMLQLKQYKYVSNMIYKR